MLNTIKEKLRQIEERENIRILHAVESGSRAWGFASPDSDYDVRFIYLRPKEYYLRLDKTRDVIEWQLDDTLDINGWDLKKALGLLHKSNPTLFEWNISPIVYKTSDEWAEISSVIESYFNKKAMLYHYLSTAKSNRSIFLRNERVIYKKYFYMLRPILACEWIMAEGTPPPMLFKTLMEKHLDDGLLPEVLRLLSIKTSMTDMGEGCRIAPIDEYINREIEKIEGCAKGLPNAENLGWERLNELFLKLL